MGYMKHNAMIITHYNLDQLKKAHDKAISLPLGVSPISEIDMNGYSSFCIFPDGGKEGWKRSDEAEEARDELVRYMKDIDECGFIQWVEVIFGDEHSPPRIFRSHDQEWF